MSRVRVKLCLDALRSLGSSKFLMEGGWMRRREGELIVSSQNHRRTLQVCKMLQYHATTLVKNTAMQLAAASKCAQTVAEFEIGRCCREPRFDVCEILSLSHFVDPPHQTTVCNYTACAWLCFSLVLVHHFHLRCRVSDSFSWCGGKTLPCCDLPGLAWHRKFELSVWLCLPHTCICICICICIYVCVHCLALSDSAWHRRSEASISVSV